MNLAKREISGEAIQKAMCRIPLDRAGFGVLIETTEEKKRLTLQKKVFES